MQHKIVRGRSTCEAPDELAGVVAERVASRGGHVLFKGKRLGDAGVAAISANLSGVVVLNLCQCSFGPAGAAALASALSSEAAAQLSELNLSSNELGPAGASALAGALTATSALLRLNLSACAIQDGGALDLAKSFPHLQSLTSLNLRRNGLSTEACGRIVEATADSKLTELSLAANHADDALLAGLEAVLTRNALRACDGSCCLRGRGLGDAAAGAVAAALPSLPSLRSVDLRGNALTAAGIDALVEAVASNTSLTELDIRGCPATGTPSARRLAGRLAVNALRHASKADTVRVAGDRDLGDEGAEEVSSFLATGPPIASLGLQHNGIGPRGALAIAAALPAVTALRELLMYSNAIGAEGAAAIAGALPSQLTSLDIGSNSLGDAGARAVASVLAGNTAMVELHLDYNGIGEEGALAVLGALKTNSVLRSFWFSGNSATQATIEALEAEVARTRAEAGQQEAPPSDESDEEPPAALEMPSIPSASGTCRFADDVADASIRTYLRYCGAHALGARGQIVLAALLLHDTTRLPHLRVVSMGVGTKFMPEEAARSDGQLRSRVRDSHAEILARRAFLRFLYAEVNACLDGSGGGVLEVAASGRYALREGVTLHLYVSTAPCGWASSGWEGCGLATPPAPRDLRADEFPAPLDLQEPPAGEAWPLLAKGSGDATAPPGCVRLGAASQAAGVDGVCLSCSDKIARWQELGLEGSLMSHILEGPLRLSSITVGRKFDHVRCERALRRGGRPIAAQQTGLSLEAVVAAARGGRAAGAQLEKGDGDESLTWALGDERAARHDGRTGALLSAGGGAPSVAGSRLLASLNAIRARRGEGPFASCVEAKEAAKARRQRRSGSVWSERPQA